MPVLFKSDELPMPVPHNDVLAKRSDTEQCKRALRTRQLQQLRRLDRPGSQHDLLCRIGCERLSAGAGDELGAGRNKAPVLGRLQQEFCDLQRIENHRERLKERRSRKAYLRIQQHLQVLVRRVRAKVRRAGVRPHALLAIEAEDGVDEPDGRSGLLCGAYTSGTNEFQTAGDAHGLRVGQDAEGVQRLGDVGDDGEVERVVRPLARASINNNARVGTNWTYDNGPIESVDAREVEQRLGLL
jgi:hypothetical protein